MHTGALDRGKKLHATPEANKVACNCTGNYMHDRRTKFGYSNVLYGTYLTSTYDDDQCPASHLVRMGEVNFCPKPLMIKPLQLLQRPISYSMCVLYCIAVLSRLILYFC